MKPIFFTPSLMIAALFMACVTSNAYAHNSQSQLAKKTIAITQIVDHQSLNKIRKGILDVLAENGFKEGKGLVVHYQNAQGNIATASQIAQSFSGLKVDVMIGITTPSAQTLRSANKSAKTPLVFAAVTDPIGAKLLKRLDKPYKNITGTIDLPPADQQIALIKSYMPAIKTLGILYNPGETNNVMQVKMMREAARTSDIKVIEANASKTADVPSSAESLVGKIDALLVPNDNTVIAAFNSVHKVMEKHGIPIFTSDPESVKLGAKAAVANDQYEVGRQTGLMVLRILKGESITTIPPEKVNKTKVYKQN